jgi:hypothetical protein
MTLTRSRFCGLGRSCLTHQTRKPSYTTPCPQKNPASRSRGIATPITMIRMFSGFRLTFHSSQQLSLVSSDTRIAELRTMYEDYDASSALFNIVNGRGNTVKMRWCSLKIHIIKNSGLSDSLSPTVWQGTSRCLEREMLAAAATRSLRVQEELLESLQQGESV